MEKSSPLTVAGAVADLTEASPHSHVVDLATNEPERVHHLINFIGVNQPVAFSLLEWVQVPAPSRCSLHRRKVVEQKRLVLFVAQSITVVGLLAADLKA